MQSGGNYKKLTMKSYIRTYRSYSLHSKSIVSILVHTYLHICRKYRNGFLIYEFDLIFIYRDKRASVNRKIYLLYQTKNSIHLQLIVPVS